MPLDLMPVFLLEKLLKQIVTRPWIKLVDQSFASAQFSFKLVSTRAQPKP